MATRGIAKFKSSSGQIFNNTSTTALDGSTSYVFSCILDLRPKGTQNRFFEIGNRVRLSTFESNSLTKIRLGFGSSPFFETDQIYDSVVWFYAVWNGTAQTLDFYVNGILVKQFTSANSVPSTIQTGSRTMLGYANGGGFDVVWMGFKAVPANVAADISTIAANPTFATFGGVGWDFSNKTSGSVSASDPELTSSGTIAGESGTITLSLNTGVSTSTYSTVTVPDQFYPPGIVAHVGTGGQLIIMRGAAGTLSLSSGTSVQVRVVGGAKAGTYNCYVRDIKGVAGRYAIRLVDPADGSDLLVSGVTNVYITPGSSQFTDGGAAVPSAEQEVTDNRWLNGSHFPTSVPTLSNIRMGVNAAKMANFEPATYSDLLAHSQNWNLECRSSINSYGYPEGVQLNYANKGIRINNVDSEEESTFDVRLLWKESQASDAPDIAGAADVGGTKNTNGIALLGSGTTASNFKYKDYRITSASLSSDSLVLTHQTLNGGSNGLYWTQVQLIRSGDLNSTGDGFETVQDSRYRARNYHKVWHRNMDALDTNHRSVALPSHIPNTGNTADTHFSLSTNITAWSILSSPDAWWSYGAGLTFDPTNSNHNWQIIQLNVGDTAGFSNDMSIRYLTISGLTGATPPNILTYQATNTEAGVIRVINSTGLEVALRQGSYSGSGSGESGVLNYYAPKGVGYDVLARMASENGHPIYIQIGHAETQACLEAELDMALQALAARSDTTTEFYFGLSNEVWNFGFDQTWVAKRRGLVDFSSYTTGSAEQKGYLGLMVEKYKWVKDYLVSQGVSASRIHFYLENQRGVAVGTWDYQAGVLKNTAASGGTLAPDMWITNLYVGNPISISAGAAGDWLDETWRNIILGDGKTAENLISPASVLDMVVEDWEVDAFANATILAAAAQSSGYGFGSYEWDYHFGGEGRDTSIGVPLFKVDVSGNSFDSTASAADWVSACADAANHIEAGKLLIHMYSGLNSLGVTGHYYHYNIFSSWDRFGTWGLATHSTVDTSLSTNNFPQLAVLSGYIYNILNVVTNDVSNIYVISGIINDSGNLCTFILDGDQVFDGPTENVSNRPSIISNSTFVNLSSWSSPSVVSDKITISATPSIIIRSGDKVLADISSSWFSEDGVGSNSQPNFLLTNNSTQSLVSALAVVSGTVTENSVEFVISGNNPIISYSTRPTFTPKIYIDRDGTQQEITLSSESEISLTGNILTLGYSLSSPAYVSESVSGLITSGWVVTDNVTHPTVLVLPISNNSTGIRPVSQLYLSDAIIQPSGDKINLEFTADSTLLGYTRNTRDIVSLRSQNYPNTNYNLSNYSEVSLTGSVLILQAEINSDIYQSDSVTINLQGGFITSSNGVESDGEVNYDTDNQSALAEPLIAINYSGYIYDNGTAFYLNFAASGGDFNSLVENGASRPQNLLNNGNGQTVSITSWGSGVVGSRNYEMSGTLASTIFSGTGPWSITPSTNWVVDNGVSTNANRVDLVNQSSQSTPIVRVKDNRLRAVSSFLSRLQSIIRFKDWL